MALQAQNAGHGLTPQEIQDLRQVFDLMDKDGGGTLCVDEVQGLMELLGMQPSMSDVREMIAEIDTDGSGTVDFEEFLQVVSKPQQLPYSKADLLRSFRMFAEPDAPKGCIGPEALEQALLQYCADMMDPDEISRLVATMDTNSQGYINYKDKLDLFIK